MTTPFNLAFGESRQRTKTRAGCLSWCSLRDKQQGRCIRYYLPDNQNVCQVSRMMNIQQPVRLIVFIYQQESLLCCSMSIGYWCNIKWVLFSYAGGDIPHAPPKKQQTATGGSRRLQWAWGLQATGKPEQVSTSCSSFLQGQLLIFLSVELKSSLCYQLDRDSVNCLKALFCLISSLVSPRDSSPAAAGPGWEAFLEGPNSVAWR